MSETTWMADRFEAGRPRLRALAYRMLGSLAEADDALQQAWLKVGGAEAGPIDNVDGWLTTVVARTCLDLLRAREARREDAMGADLPAPIADRQRAPDAEEEALLADSVGLALLVVLDTLAPAERLAFVLHDLFGVAFDEIAPIVGRSEEAARQLASRARRRVRGAPVEDAERGRKQEQRAVVDAFLAAVRKNDFAALLSILDPEVVLRGDEQAMRGQGALELRGAKAVAERSLRGGARLARPALIGGEVGVVVAPKGKLVLALRFTLAGGRVAQIEAIADPARLAQLELAVVVDQLAGTSPP